jgi:hypothetical protein
MDSFTVPPGQLHDRLASYLGRIPQVQGEIATYLECQGETTGNFHIELGEIRVVLDTPVVTPP